MTATETERAERVEKIVATAKLETLLEKPDTPIKILPDNAGVKVGDTRSFWQRAKDSWTMRLQAITGIIATIWMTVPQETFLAVIPTEYVARATLAYVILTALLRMRTT